MTWCPCHGDMEGVRCLLRGDEPIMSRTLCGCIRLRVDPPLGRNEVYVFRKHRVLHEAGCSLGAIEVDRRQFPKMEMSKKELAQRAVDERRAKKDARKRKRQFDQTVLELPKK